MSQTDEIADLDALQNHAREILADAARRGVTPPPHPQRKLRKQARQFKYGTAAPIRAALKQRARTRGEFPGADDKALPKRIAKAITAELESTFAAPPARPNAGHKAKRRPRRGKLPARRRQFNIRAAIQQRERQS